MHRTRTSVRFALLAPLLALAACGDDEAADETTTTTAVSASSLAASSVSASSVSASSVAPSSVPARALATYCTIASEIVESDAPPTVEQVQAYAAAAPDAIAEPASIVLAAFEEADGDIEAVFRDQEAIDALAALTAFESEACGLANPVDDASTQIDADATRVDVLAADYEFVAQFPSTGGRYSFVMTNNGAEPHLMALVHLEDGADFDEVMSSEGESGVIAAFESSVAAPGGEAVITADLGPGQWVLVCPIPDAAGVSHAEHGMVHEFTIT